MNPNTGDFIEDTEADPLPEEWVRFSLNEVVEVKGVLMEVVYVQQGRITFRPVVRYKNQIVSYSDSMRVLKLKEE